LVAYFIKLVTTHPLRHLLEREQVHVDYLESPAWRARASEISSHAIAAYRPVLVKAGLHGIGDTVASYIRLGFGLTLNFGAQVRATRGSAPEEVSTQLDALEADLRFQGRDRARAVIRTHLSSRAAFARPPRCPAKHGLHGSDPETRRVSLTSVADGSIIERRERVA